ncbi:MAG TPA: tRNA (N(6)-L-threonylcarbamoyladenosine(37)-C(2))-methylthiotransferase MtaB [Syntrophomonas sp.]|jgi:threonylcarbamoyladenosine tRNA methylthiotransferase MtaB|nr:tRNA (N(6)-L-threonylcarbamoyladenosine(37)-C(2))-methylthiotransferase MtaB [Syntrophomonas sp.]
MKKAAFYTLGCKVNQVDTEQIKEAFLKQGYQVVDFNEAADIYVINTCTVTHVSDRKSRAVIRRAARRNPLAQIVVTGCLAQADPDQIKAIPGVSMVVDNQDKERIPDLVGGTVRGDADGVFASLTPVLFTGRHERTRAFIKIEDGCHSYCSYCIVPYTRGAVRSKRPEHVQAELQRLVELGYREIVLTGIHTGLYGYDLKNINLTELLKQLLGEVDGDYRIRLSSIEPLEICPALLQLVQQEPRICRHFHVPLQSGSDTVLKAMNRRYNGQYYRDLILEISKRIPGVGLSADVMVGFPGESRQDFQATYDLLAELPLLDLHVFKYSRREGTPAALMKGQIDEGVKQERSQALLQLARDKHFQRLENSCGQMLRVLVEQRIQAQTYTGLSDNYIEVRWDSSRDLRGEFAKVRIIGQEQGVAMGCVDDIPVH